MAQLNPVVKYDPMYTSASMNTVSFFTGEDDDDYTRYFAQWNGSSNVGVTGKTYATTKTTTTVVNNPWPMTVPVNGGTDGLQFPPDLEDEDNLYVYMPAFSRTVHFHFMDENEEAPQSKKLEQNNYMLCPMSLQTAAMNPENEGYSIMIDGTTNLTTTIGACAFATQGRFYGLSTDATVQASVPVIKNESGQAVTASMMMDSAMISTEPSSGLVLSSQQAWQTVLNVFNDNLISLNGLTMYGQFMPLIYIKKTSTLDSDQVEDLLPNVFKQMKNEWVLFWVFLIAAILFALVGVVLCIKSRGLAAQAAQEAAQNKEANGN